MIRGRQSAATVLSVIAAALVLSLPVWRGYVSSAAQRPREAAADDATVSLLIKFGVRDPGEKAWDGNVSVRNGEIAGLRDWHPMAANRIGGRDWALATRREPNRDVFEPDSPGRELSPNFHRPGVVVDLKATPGAVIVVKTVNGAFEIPYAELQARGRLSRLDGAVEVELVPTARKLSVDDFESDGPSVFGAPNGDVWAAFTGYRDGGNGVFVRRLAGGRWSAAEALTETTSDVFSVKLGGGKSGVWAVWSAQVEGNFDLYGRHFNGGAWSAPVRLSENLQPDAYHNVVGDSSGNVWLVWQGFRGGQSDIFARRFDGERWLPEERVSSSNANDWEPTVAAGPKGELYVAWDTYESGSYDVVMRRYSAGSWSDLVPVARTEKFEAHASIACDRVGRVWLAWSEGGTQWGKDTGFLLKAEGTPLYEDRSIATAVYDNGAWFDPPRMVASALPLGLREYNDFPTIALDGEDRPWIFFRHRSLRRTPPYVTYWERGLWEWHASYLDGGRWAVPMSMPFSQGHMDMRISVGRGSEGQIHAAYATDNRDYSEYLFRSNDVYAARIPGRAMPARTLTLVRRPPASAQPLIANPRETRNFTLHPRETEDTARIRNYRIETGGAVYRIYRGDTHRHTEFSMDGNNDGSLQEAYRYALDAGALDFLAVSDHNADGGPDIGYVNWVQQQMVDVFTLPGSFSPIYGYERSVVYPNGHRNVLFAKRGVPALFIPPEERQGKLGALSLYDYLRLNGGIAIPHSPATNMGTDWRDNDPELEPLVEIYQGDRVSAEYEGAPRASSAGAPTTQPGGFRPAGFVWNAWGTRGYKLGVQASSDHLSTHISYACTLAPGLSRENLIEAMRRRHSYGATDNIVLDYRLRAGGREYIQGDAVAVSGPFQLAIRVAGTAPSARST